MHKHGIREIKTRLERLNKVAPKYFASQPQLLILGMQIMSNDTINIVQLNKFMGFSLNGTEGAAVLANVIPKSEKNIGMIAVKLTNLLGLIISGLIELRFFKVTSPSSR